MRIVPFELERWQSLHEHHVEVNLSDSGIHPVSVSDLGLESAELAALLDRRLVYTQTNGTPELRDSIAALYPGATGEHVQVVNGGSEANFVAMWSVLEPGDEVVAMLPNYMQVPGLAKAFGATVRPWWMRPDASRGRWVADLDELGALVSDRTRLVAICNPNNPTGACLGKDELDQIGRIADTYGAWVLSDEIYQGAELDGHPTATMWGRTRRPIVTNSLSKAYGLPGLRLGWIVSEPAACADFWAHHDYTTIGPGTLSDALGTRVLGTSLRERLLTRTREHLRANLIRVHAWLEGCGDRVWLVPPVAGAMLYLGYAGGTPSATVAKTLLDEHSVLIVPGQHYDMEGWVRVGFGGDERTLASGLDRLRAVLSTGPVDDRPGRSTPTHTSLKGDR